MHIVLMYASQRRMKEFKSAGGGGGGGGGRIWEKGVR